MCRAAEVIQGKLKIKIHNLKLDVELSTELDQINKSYYTFSHKIDVFRFVPW